MSMLARGRLLTWFALGICGACSVYDQSLLTSPRVVATGGRGARGGAAGASHDGGSSGDVSTGGSAQGGIAGDGAGGASGSGAAGGTQTTGGTEPVSGGGGGGGAANTGGAKGGGSSGGSGAGGTATGGSAPTGGKSSTGGMQSAGEAGAAGSGGADTCTNGVTDGTETGKDCGGECPACALGQPCAVDGDCQSTHCISKACSVIDCTDKARDGRETDIDCGGADCPRCGAGQMCTAHSDCTTGACVSKACAYQRSCAELKTLAPTLPDGLYSVDPDGAAGANAAFAVYCDMTTAGGGWTRVGYEPAGAGGTMMNGALRNLGTAVGTGANVANKTAAGLIGSRFNGLYTELRISWGTDYAQMTVSANIFVDSAQVALPVSKVSSSNSTLTGWLTGGAVFCRAATSTYRAGDTSWALVPSNNSNTTCGCNGMGWTGNGIYYGGSSPADSCTGWGGGFAGVRAVGEQKGGVTSATELVLWVR